MSEETKKYICKLPTNGHQVGDEVFLTDAEVANVNGGEAEPRYVLAEDQVSQEVAPTDVTPNQVPPPQGDVGNVAPPEGTGNAPQQ
jgi:hypothetical protein